MRYPQWFDLGEPSIAQVRGKCNIKQVYDTGPMIADPRIVADAVLDATIHNSRARMEGRTEAALILDPSSFWDHEKEAKTYSGRKKLDSPIKWKKLAPTVELNRSYTTREQAIEHEHLPEKRMGMITDSSGRRVQLYGFPDLHWDPGKEYRGVGWWGPTKGMHHTVLFDALFEGPLLAGMLPGNIIMRYIGPDLVVEVDSTSIDGKKYSMAFTPAPTTLEGGTFHVEWADMARIGGRADDAIFREISSMGRENGRTVRIDNYSGGEVVFDRHAVAAYMLAARQSRLGEIPVQVDTFPWLREFGVELYHTAKNRVISRNHVGAGLKTKAELGALLGKCIAYAGGFEETHIFPEEPYSERLSAYPAKNPI